MDNRNHDEVSEENIVDIVASLGKDVEEDVEETAASVEETVEEVEDASEEVKETLEEAVEAPEAVEETAEEVAETVSDEVEEAEAVSEEAVEEIVSEAKESSDIPSIDDCLDIIPAALPTELSTAEEKAEETVEEAVEEKEETKIEETSDEEKSSSEDSEENESSEEKEESEEAEESEESDESSVEKKDKEESEKEKSAIYMFLDTIKFVAIGLLVGILLVVFVIQRNDVYGSSMEPTLYTGDAVFVEMISVYTGNFHRGDIITIDAKGMEGYTHEENLIKRIIGLPGETIKIADGNVYINGELLDESDYLPAGTKTFVGAEGQSRGYDEVTLGPDEYYCMGDNRGGSNDSRRMGPFKKKQIDAKVLMRIYPFNKMKFY
ncbi:MAG: signal peptidase I [Clostridiales bacterium]|nr:signal peptidase I [Clostridiales bacterium]